jgi:hypothetical protein
MGDWRQAMTKTLEEQIAEALAERDALVVHEVEADSEVPS